MLFLTEEDELKNKANIKCLYFYSSWMPYNKKMLSIINKMEEKYNDIAYIAIDVDNFSGICHRFNINSIPTILILLNGEEIKKVNGLILTSALRRIFSDIYTDNTKVNGDSNAKES
jgi:thioredoxin-like negative regulator of GroEL